jgi:hypothetical protein
MRLSRRGFERARAFIEEAEPPAQGDHAADEEQEEDHSGGDEYDRALGGGVHLLREASTPMSYRPGVKLVRLKRAVARADRIVAHRPLPFAQRAISKHMCNRPVSTVAPRRYRCSAS